MRTFIAGKRSRTTMGGALLFGSVLTLYWKVIRPWHLRWGATDAEVQMPIPGNTLIPDATLVATRAIDAVGDSAAR